MWPLWETRRQNNISGSKRKRHSLLFHCTLKIQKYAAQLCSNSSCQVCFALPPVWSETHRASQTEPLAFLKVLVSLTSFIAEASFTSSSSLWFSFSNQRFKKKKKAPANTGSCRALGVDSQRHVRSFLFLMFFFLFFQNTTRDGAQHAAKGG